MDTNEPTVPAPLVPKMLTVNDVAYIRHIAKSGMPLTAARGLALCDTATALRAELEQIRGVRDELLSERNGTIAKLYMYTNDQLREALVASADECVALRAELAARDADLAAARRDSERLDQIQKWLDVAEMVKLVGPFHFSIVRYKDAYTPVKRGAGSGESIRAAIDAARSSAVAATPTGEDARLVDLLKRNEAVNLAWSRERETKHDGQ